MCVSVKDIYIRLLHALKSDFNGKEFDFHFTFGSFPRPSFVPEVSLWGKMQPTFSTLKPWRVIIIIIYRSLKVDLKETDRILEAIMEKTCLMMNQKGVCLDWQKQHHAFTGKKKNKVNDEKEIGQSPYHCTNLQINKKTPLIALKTKQNTQWCKWIFPKKENKKKVTPKNQNNQLSWKSNLLHAAVHDVEHSLCWEAPFRIGAAIGGEWSLVRRRWHKPQSLTPLQQQQSDP